MAPPARPRYTAGVSFDEVAPVIRMDLSRIIISETNDEQVIVLKECEGTRAFPIVIGIWEAVAIDRNLKGKKTPRPMTHDLVGNILETLGASLEKVVITDLRDRTFYARLFLKRGAKTVEVDSRPSDAVALAVQLQAPIFVNESVLDEVLPAGGLPESGPPPEEGPDPDEGGPGEPD